MLSELFRNLNGILEILPKYMIRVHKDWKMILETVETVHIKYAQNYIFMYVLK